MKNSLSRRAAVRILLLSSLMTACPTEPEGAPPTPPAAKPVREPLAPDTKTSLPLADQRIPKWIKAYEAVEATYDGDKATSVRVERYQRGKCLKRQIYAGQPTGSFVSQKLEIEATPAGTAPGGPAFAALTEKAAAPRTPRFMVRRDDQDRLTLTNETILDKSGAVTNGRIVTHVRFDVEDCSLPDFVRAADLPKWTDAPDGGKPELTAAGFFPAAHPDGGTAAADAGPPLAPAAAKP
jgi:hypothetical protein